MKSNLKTKTIISLTIGIALAFSAVIATNLNFIAGSSDRSAGFSDEITLDNENVRLSKISGPIYIDDDNPSFNWSIAKDAGICTGNGTYSDPYVIEDLIIDAENSGSGIEIRNTDRYLIIKNCTIINSGPSWPTAGIKLGNVKNINITDCKINNNIDGIHIYGSFNLSISRNDIRNNNVYSIFFYSTDNSTFSENNMTYNYNGLLFEYSNNNILTNNTISHIHGTGLTLAFSHNNTFSGNVLEENGIIILDSSDNNIDSTNLIDGKSILYNEDQSNLIIDGISNGEFLILLNCSQSIITNSIFSGITGTNCNSTSITNVTILKYGGYFYEFDSCNISENEIVNNKRGMTLHNSDNTYVSNNNASNNDGSGITAVDSYDVSIFNNHISSNGQRGISTGRLQNSAIYNNLVENNPWGITVYSSDNNAISNNTIFNNVLDGIVLDSSNLNNLSGNRITYNTKRSGWGCGLSSCYNGVYLESSDNNIITQNEISHNFNGFSLEDSKYNKISLNNVTNSENNGFILDADSSDNKIWLNNIDGNKVEQVLEESSGNQWDNGTLGNYWSDYTQKYSEASNIGGIWDTPYQINSSYGSEDRFPLIYPFIMQSNLVADFTVNLSEIVEGQLVKFNDKTSGGVPLYSYEWDFGDGSANSTEVNPVHQFISPGTYNVILTVQDSVGNFSVCSPLTITVSEDLIPSAQFTANITEIYIGMWIQFTDASTSGNPPLKYQWDFGDGSANSTDRNPIHQYNSAGNYTVILTVTDLNGDSDFLIKIDYIIVQQEPTTTPGGGIPGYNLFFLLGILSVAIILISKKLKKA